MKASWSKILFIASDAVIAVYLVLAFASFDKKGDSKAMCSKVDIEIADNATGGFLDAKVIKERLQKTGYYPIGKPLSEVNARGIEEMLRQSPFVKTAECYKTEGGHVYISVTQRMPVIRIKADNGDDYYVDDNDCIMPRTNYTSDLIIASGSISRWYAINYISPLGKAIMQNDLWKNLIEQIHILPGQGVELVPRIGDHIVYIGRLPDGNNRQKHEADIAEFVAKKMTRLEKFYKYGLSQVGWNKYSYINIEFDNQIICKRKDGPAVAHTEPTPTQPTQATPPQPAEDGPSEGEIEPAPQNTSAPEPAPKQQVATTSSNKQKSKPEEKPKKTSEAKPKKTSGTKPKETSEAKPKKTSEAKPKNNSEAKKKGPETSQKKKGSGSVQNKKSSN